MRIIAGMARGRTFDAPQGLDTRPTLDRVRESLFNILQLRVRGARVLDLFAGSGALSLESLSRGAESAVMVDHSRAAIACIRKNVETLRFSDRARIIHTDWRAAVETLRKEGAVFDLMMLDPPYAMVELSEVTEAIRPLLSDHAMLVIEHDYRTMPHVADGYDAVDTRKYGIVGITFFEPVAEENL